MTLRQESSWRVHDEQDLGAFGRGRLRRVSVDLPDGVTFDQYVMRDYRRRVGRRDQ